MTETIVENALRAAVKENTLGQEERRLLKTVTGPQSRLDYPTVPLEMSDGSVVERYEIPDEDREDVLESLYPFACAPLMSAELFDLHSRKFFKVRDFIVTREDGCNFLMSPYYAEAGGTVLDWLDISGNEELMQLVQADDEDMPFSDDDRQKPCAVICHKVERTGQRAED